MEKGRTYTESIYYEIRLTAKYLRYLGEQLFGGLNISEVNFEEFMAMDIINNHSPLCQRDLAKLLLKDRANTGRIITRLEEKGFVKVKLDKKQNRPVKLLTLTSKGKKLLEEIIRRIRPYIEYIEKGFDEEYEEKVTQMLKELRYKLSELVETQI